MKTKPYKTKRDMQWKNRAWYTGEMTRKLTGEEAKPLLEQGLIYEPQPKRYVILNGKKMAWGDYLKQRKGRQIK